MKNWVFIFALSCCSASVYSQSSLQNFTLDVQNLKAREANPELAYETISGDPYYSSGFIDSKVYLISGDTISIPLRYDLYKDEMEFRKDEKIMWVNKKEARRIAYGDKQLIICPGKSQNALVYFFVLAEGEYSLLRRQKVNFMPPEELKGFAEPKPARFEPASMEYFIQFQDRAPVAIIAKKDLREIAGSDASAIEFLGKEKIRRDREKDLVKYVTFLNTTNIEPGMQE